MRNSTKFPLLLVAAVIGIAACSSDNSPTSPTAGGTIDSSTASNGLTIVIDTTSVNDTAAVATVIVARVHVTQSGSGVPGTTVTWTLNTGGGTIYASSSVTDITGLATVNWTLGDTAGTNTITAGITGAQVTINAIGVGRTASAIAKVTSDSSVVVAGAALPLTARVVDDFGNASANTTVLWTASAGSLSADSSVSGANGDATSNFTAPTTPGTYTVTASLPDIASVTFKVVVQ